MDVLQSLENYIHIDISRVFNNVLLYQTQPVDGLTGEHTITHKYTNWYLEVLLRHVSQGHIIYSPLQKAFVSLSSEEKLPFSAEEFSDVKELRALAELLGPYGMRYMGEQLMYRVALYVNELKQVVISNKETLMQLRTSFDKPDVMVELAKKLENPENVLQRLTIIGVLLSFRHMLQNVLHDTMVDHAPFLISSIKDFSDNVPAGSDSIYVTEMAGSAGFECSVDPLLVAAIRNQKPEGGEDQYTLSCLLMVFVAVIIPRRASTGNSAFEPSLQGHANNTHCMARAINQLAQALFLVHSRDNDVEERLKEFLALASSSLLRLGQENEKEAIRTRESVYLLLYIIVQESNVLSMDLLESCFPYVLIRNAYSAVMNSTAATSHHR
ncbi:Hem [Bugula neritina]|uniref:Hem n=1 Tax=Bugula neritina TaxID=10212 RepID=A0A7J7JMY9_BUGNE|nr:Hem [Bugula neritina]